MENNKNINPNKDFMAGLFSTTEDLLKEIKNEHSKNDSSNTKKEEIIESNTEYEEDNLDNFSQYKKGTPQYVLEQWHLRESQIKNLIVTQLGVNDDIWFATLQMERKEVRKQLHNMNAQAYIKFI